MVVGINKEFSEKRNIPNVCVIPAFLCLWQVCYILIFIIDITIYSSLS